MTGDAKRRLSLSYEVDFSEKACFRRIRADIKLMSGFGPSPITPNAPSLVQASFIAQHATGAKPREKAKPTEVATSRVFARDEVRLSDPLKAEAIDPKPDAVEEWKQRRGHPQPHAPLPDAATQRRDGESPPSHLDIKA